EGGIAASCAGAEAPDARPLDLRVLQRAGHRNLVGGEPGEAGLREVAAAGIADEDGDPARRQCREPGHEPVSERLLVEGVADEDDVPTAALADQVARYGFDGDGIAGGVE